MTTNQTTTETGITEAKARRIVVRTLLLFVVPAFLVLGVGTTAALWVGWQEERDREHDLCVRSVEARDEVRAAFDGVFDLYPDSDAVVAARQAIDRVLPPRDVAEC